MALLSGLRGTSAPPAPAGDLVKGEMVLKDICLTVPRGDCLSVEPALLQPGFLAPVGRGGEGEARDGEGPFVTRRAIRVLPIGA